MSSGPAPAAATVLAARGLVAGYGSVEVLHGVDLECREGERVALVGPNAAGKTTLLRCLAGLLRPRAGEVLLDGMPLARLSARARARRIAVVPQTFDTPFAFSVREVVSLGRTAYTGPFGGLSLNDRAAIDRALGDAECAGLAERPFAELSGGERQRAVVAMALAQEADVLLLDEPTVHLDPGHQRDTLVRLGRIARERGRVCVAVLHDLSLAAALCDRIVVVDGGGIAADGPPEVVLTQRTVERIFGPGLQVLEDRTPPAVLPRA